MTTDKLPARVHQDLLDLADFAYQRLAVRLRGLTDEEYFWEPAPGCLTIEPAGDGTYQVKRAPMPLRPAPLTTIAWRLCHVIDLLAAERNATWLAVTPTGALKRDGEPGTAGAATDQLDRAYALFRAHVAAADPDALAEPMGELAGPYGQSSRAAFVLHELDELIHHGSEIACMRDVYRATRPVDPFVAACQGGDLAAVESALAADPGLRERHAAVIAQAAARAHWPVVRALVDHGFDVDASDGISALHYAAGYGELPVVRLLAEHGADRTARDAENDVTPAGWARYMRHEDVRAYLES